MLNNRALLLNGIILLFRESRTVNKDRSIDLINKVLETVTNPEAGLRLDNETQIIVGLKELLLQMRNDPDDVEYVIPDMLSRLRLILKEDDVTYDSIKESLATEVTTEENRKAVSVLRRSLNDHFKSLEIKKLINKASAIINFKPEEITNTADFISGLIAELDPYAGSGSDVKPYVMDFIDFDNIETVVDIFKKVDDNLSGESLMRLGWQDVNTSIGGGLYRGLTYLISAQQHCYKSGFTNDVFRHVAMYNKPFLYDETKKPLLMHISAENTSEQNVSFLYERIHENLDTSVKVTPEFMSNISAEEKARYVNSHLTANGFHIRMIKVIPHETTYRDLQNLILDAEADGYEVALCVIDYLCMINTVGCSTSGSYGGAEFKDLFKRMRNFCNARRTTLFTPHQMSTEALQLVRDKTDDLVKQVAGGGYYAGSKQIQQEVDCEMFIHKVVINDESYITYQRGKLRSNTIVPESKKYTCYKFQAIGGLIDDINGNNMGLPRPGATIKENGAVEDAWW